MPRIVKFNHRVVQRVDLEDALEEFLLAKQADGISQRTLDDYRSHVGAFLKASPNLTTYEALQKAVIRYFSQACSPGYRNIRLRYLKAFFNWCVAQGYLPANPVAGIRPAKEDLLRVRHVPLEALKKLLNVPDKKTYAGLRDYCLMLVQIDTGARPGELFQVRPAYLNLEAGELYIRPEIAKTRVGRTLVLSPFTCQALARLLEERPQWWDEDTPYSPVKTETPLMLAPGPSAWLNTARKQVSKLLPMACGTPLPLSFSKQVMTPLPCSAFWAIKTSP